MAENGRTFSIEYTLTLEDGSKVDTNVGDEPLEFQEGAGQILPALEAEIVGLQAGESTQVTLPPEKGYGPVHDEAYQEVEKEAIPEEARHEGANLIAQDEQGHQHQVRVKEIKDDTILLDLNHPLAGETLNFDVKVVDIK